MLAAILRKAVADLRSRPLQSLLLAAVICAAAATLSLALTVGNVCLAKPYERTAAESNAADLWVSFSSPSVNPDVVKTLAGVEATSGPYPVSWSNYSINNGEK